MKRPRLIAAVLCTALQAGVALASWYDDYEAGLKALHDGQFQVVVQKMTAAINGNPKENNNSRTYGNIFINYHPYYYRAIGYMNLGKYEQAVADLEKTSGPGPVDRGSIESLMQEAKKKLADIDTKPQPPPIPLPGPDPALRSRAEVLLEQANARLQAAVQRRATEAPAYQSALQRYIGANAKLGAAKSNDDLNAIITEAGAIIKLADSAQPAPAPPPPIGLDPALRSRAQASLTQANTHLQSAAQRKATDAQAYQDAMLRYASANTKLANAKSNEDLNVIIAEAGTIITLADSAQPRPAVLDPTKRLRRAFQSYYKGDFAEATRDFQTLTGEMPCVWAFLGASQYSQYALGASETYKASAINSFRKARACSKWKDGLPEKYFSRKIRKVFKENAG